MVIMKPLILKGINLNHKVTIELYNRERYVFENPHKYWVEKIEPKSPYTAGFGGYGAGSGRTIWTYKGSCKTLVDLYNLPLENGAVMYVEYVAQTFACTGSGWIRIG